MKIVKSDDKNIIEKTGKVLRQSGLVIFPSDTVYGALVDATDEKAVKKLISFKSRPPGKAISVFVSSFKMIDNFVEVNKKQNEMLQEILPGPFTIILPSKHKTSRLLESEKGTLGVRLPSYQLINQLSHKYGKAITATSANLSGRAPHYSVESLLWALTESKKQLIDLVVDAGKLPRNKPSTIIDLSLPKIKILRQGEIIFKDSRTFISVSPNQTKEIAKLLISRWLKKNLTKPLIFIIQGELGVGKTVFVKGVGDYLGVKNIISPSFVIYYEYPVSGNLISRLVHIDLYNIEESDEFKYLGLEKYLKDKNLLCFEWGEKTGEILNLLQKKGKIIYINMKYINEQKREISVKY